jgi:hypothetical protein
MKKNVFVPGVCCLLSVGLAQAGTGHNANTGVAGQDADLEFVTGEHWSQSSEVERNAYLYGLGNMVELRAGSRNGPGTPRYVPGRWLKGQGTGPDAPAPAVADSICRITLEKV